MRSQFLSWFGLTAAASPAAAMALIEFGARKLGIKPPTSRRGESVSSPRLPIAALDGGTSPRASTTTELRSLLLESQQRGARYATEVSHELMTPLSAQCCVGELALRDGVSNEELRDAIATMLEGSRHMQNLIGGLLLAAQADHGMLGTPTTTIDATQIANRAVSTMAPLVDEHEQTISLEANGPQPILGQSTLLLQALLNIIHNAISHTPEGTHIRVQVEECKQYGVLMSVSDNGPGIPSREGEPVWLRYVRRTEDRTKRPSLGIGMSIAASLVRSQGGLMTVDSQTGKGTQVMLRFPSSTKPLSPESSLAQGRRQSDG